VPSAQIPIFLVATPGTETDFLAQSLSTDPAVAIATVAADETGGEGSVALLATSVPDGRFVFLAAQATELVPTELGALPPERWRRVDLQALLADPRTELQRLCSFAGIEYDQALLGPVEAARRAVQDGRLQDGRSPFASVSTDTFAQVLSGAASSLLISTYQTGRLVCARVRDGRLNTHFREYDKPMGIAVAPGRVALGTRAEVWDLRDMPQAAPKLDPPGSHDACYLPRNRHVTGDIAVHDLAFAGGELWLAATAFSCLATLDANHSFVPRWAPSFITLLAPEDRCHLNGLAVVDDRIAYVTALATSDEAGGWRASKASGGVIIDVASSEVVIGGLSMPHSPRWHAGRLWLLESGTGSICVADLDAGSVQVVAELPGFTRGLAFLGDVAFVGLSQIRESSTFGELPLTRRLKERQCGVWMVNLRSGAVTGFLRFDDLVQEIFDVAVLAGARFPEIAEAGDATTAHSYALP
jgi:uncharacterized protein (TIGR03032 family)